MTSGRTTLRLALLLAPLAALGPANARAQEATINALMPRAPGSVQSTLGPIPGAGSNPFRLTPGTDPGFLGGRVGTSTPHVPTSISTPGGGMAMPPTPGIAAPARVPITNVPLYGPLEVPDAAEEEGPADGLSLDEAIDRLLRGNLALQALNLQIPSSRADVLTAGLRANPILYADTQLVPYGRYNREKSGGPTQYDLNVSHPVDYSRKRQARTESAQAVLSVQEALFREAVRVQIDNLYTLFVDALAARETVRYAKASQAGLNRLLRINERLFEKSNLTRADVGRVRVMRDAAGLAVLDAEETERRSRRALGMLLNIPPAEADALQVRGTIADLAPPPPPSDELRRIAMESRPDLAAQRLGLVRANADVKLARAEGFADAYVLYQPFTFQDQSPYGLKSPTSWALGVTVPIPLYNRNQGGVLRARINVAQTTNESAAIEIHVSAEVRNAERLYQATRDRLRAVEHDALPAARRLRDDTLRLFTSGELTAVEYNTAQKDYNHAVRTYRDLLILHRRSMLSLNTSVARRVLP